MNKRRLNIAQQKDVPNATANVPRWTLPLLIAVYVAFTFLLIVRVPIGSAPDEGAHLEYVAHLAQTGSLPVFVPLGANHAGYEFHQPPLYYATSAMAWSILSPGAREIACRVVSLLCGAASLWFLWHAVILVFPQRSELTVGATFFAALWPLHQAVGASAGNDAMADLVCTALFWGVARATSKFAQNGGASFFKDAALVGALAGLGSLTKNTVLLVSCACVGTMFFAPRATTSSTRCETWTPKTSTWRGGLAAIGAMLLVGGWWLTRNQILYGDPLAARIFDVAFRQSSPRPSFFFTPQMAQALGQQMTNAIYIRALFLILFCTFWGVFGGPNTALKILNPLGARGPQPDAFALLPPMIVFLLLTFFSLWGLTRALSRWKNAEITTRLVIGSWILGGVLVLIALVNFNLIQFQAQARYLHPALVPISLGFASGWRNLFSSKRALMTANIVFAVVAIGMTLTNVLLWRTLV